MRCRTSRRLVGPPSLAAPDQRSSRIATVASVDPGELPRTGGSVPLIEGARERGLSVREESFGEPFPLQDGAEVAVLRVLEYAFDSALETGGVMVSEKINLEFEISAIKVESAA